MNEIILIILLLLLIILFITGTSLVSYYCVSQVCGTYDTWYNTVYSTASLPKSKIIQQHGKST